MKPNGVRVEMQLSGGTSVGGMRLSYSAIRPETSSQTSVAGMFSEGSARLGGRFALQKHPVIGHASS